VFSHILIWEYKHFGNVSRNLVKQCSNSDFHTFCIFLLLLQTCLKFLNYIQECTCYLEWSLFPQLGYGQFLSINIFGWCFKENDQTKFLQWFPHYFAFLLLLQTLKFLNYIHKFIWSLECSVFPQFRYAGQSKSIIILKILCQTNEKQWFP